MPALVVVTRFVGLAGHKKIASNDVYVCVGVGGSALSAAIRIGIPNEAHWPTGVVVVVQRVQFFFWAITRANVISEQLFRLIATLRDKICSLP